MRRRDARAYVADMLQACEDVGEMVSGVRPDAFAADRMRLKAVIRDLEVLGEACRGLPAELRALAGEIPWTKITAMRNKLIHEYFGVDPGIIFQTAVEDVPGLLPELRKLMAELERRSREGDDGPTS